MISDYRIFDPRSGASARIAPELGGNCYSFQPVIRGQKQEVLDTPADVLKGQLRPSSFGIPILFPFPNRIRNAKFVWKGHDYALPLPPDKPHAIHGFCLDRAWRVTERTTDTLVCVFQLSVDAPDRRHLWPADFRIEARHTVSGNRLATQFRITNPDQRPLPWGLGTHAYFKVPLHPGSQPADCHFHVNVREEWELAGNVPTGTRHALAADDTLRTGVRFGERAFDSAFTGWERVGDVLTASVLDEKAGLVLQQTCDANYFREAVVFTPPGRNAVCIEPYTCVTDAVNLSQKHPDTGWQVLAPGASVQTWVAIELLPVVA